MQNLQQFLISNNFKYTFSRYIFKYKPGFLTFSEYRYKSVFKHNENNKMYSHRECAKPQEL